MASVYPSIGIGLIEPPGVTEKAIEPPTSCVGGEGGLRWVGRCGTAVFQIKDTHFRVPGTSHNGSITRMGHELDGEDVGPVAGGNTGIEGESIWQAGRIVIPDVEISIIRA